ncbi:neutral alpha-glucosidase ab [Stylonychia lemnae]|uniref:Neutral alpha-glucosidase ab n=1 Tax=Stylonychia lemnae TaxID=5949 RepID=A0A078A037_STYLE|nr:neutral alpha-glucosidase ab [Stylonychia lemnae]|eukprot:CDW74808.1 neutral alpha-glucosidase ab [Stylonychia lemnae]
MIIRSESLDGLDKYTYTLQFEPFRLEQSIVNPKDTLMFEDYQSLMNNHQNIDIASNLDKQCLIPFVQEQTQYEDGVEVFGDYNQENDKNEWARKLFTQKFEPEYQENRYKRESFMIGFYMNSEHLFGLPERTSKFLLQTTEKTDPYRLYNVDKFPHEEWKMDSLYSSLPYITGHSKTHDQSIVYYSSSETWVDILQCKDPSGEELKTGRFVNFITESGQLEFFIIGSSQSDSHVSSPKRVSILLSTITGFINQPPLFSLGYHYSKWEAETSAQRLLEFSNRFQQENIPVDVLWADLPYANEKMYFTFHPDRFNEHDFDTLKQELKDKNRKLVLLTDPHIFAQTDYHVYQNGLLKEAELNKDQNNIDQIFVSNKDLSLFQGECWPGQSVWIDFFNSQAQKFWGEQYSYDQFRGTDSNVHIWFDMNEPSVFDGEEGTLPKNSIHLLGNSTAAFHRDVHNAYGLMGAKATYDGLIDRDHGVQRPFILSRSIFFGAQKYAAKWTGDNQANNEELSSSISQILNLGISGVPFVGADIPGFFGDADNDLYLRFYQLGVWFPFFRAHGHIDNNNREPFNQPDDIRESVYETIRMRYDFIVYLYTVFHQSKQYGYPVMRPMWFEYPQDNQTFELQDQFMIGDSILITPKLNQVECSYEEVDGQYLQKQVYLVDQYFPSSTTWYDYQTKAIIKGDGSLNTIKMQQKDLGIYIKAGSIIPMRINTNKFTSATSVQNNNIKLEIYLDDRQQATGYLYLDDGETFKYRDWKEYSYVKYEYKENALSLEILDKQSCYPESSRIHIEEVIIYGFHHKGKHHVYYQQIISENKQFKDCSPHHFHFNGDSKFSVNVKNEVEPVKISGDIIHIQKLSIPIDDICRTHRKTNNNKIQTLLLIKQ